MSDNPFLYNDQLKTKTTPVAGWDDMPVMLQEEIFEHVGHYRRVDFQRVCKSWKSLLEKWPSVFLLDEFRPSMPSSLETASPSDITRQDHLRKTRDDYSDQLRIKSREVLRVASKKSRVIIVDFPRQGIAEENFVKQVGFMSHCAGVGVLGSDRVTEHVILAAGRMTAFAFFDLSQFLGVGQTDTPLQLSFISCSIVYETGKLFQVREEIDSMYRLFSGDSGEMYIPKWSTRFPAETLILYSQMAELCGRPLFPYTFAQIEWLEGCLKMLLDPATLGQSNCDVATALSRYWRRCAVRCAFVKQRWCDMMETDCRSFAPGVDYSYLETLAVAVSFLARKISVGRLEYPAPPEPVPLCPVHTKATICPCPPSLNDVYAPFKKLTL